MKITDLQKQKVEWKRKGWAIPEFRGSKQDWFNTVIELIQLIDSSPLADLSVTPKLESTDSAYPWRMYVPFLKGLDLVFSNTGNVQLRTEGQELLKTKSKRYLADLLHAKYRLFGETLELFYNQPKTIEEIDQDLRREFSVTWENLHNTRRRTDWLEVLGLIKNVGNRKWALTEDGKKAIEDWPLVSSDVIDVSIVEKEELIITPPPMEIAKLLAELAENPHLHQKRNTYNIWIPRPNGIENLRHIVQFAFEKVSRSDLFSFIQEEFCVKASSVESMMPFLRADGLIEEVGKNIYVATSVAKAWCESGSDLDFVRILHAHRRFVGEMIKAAESCITRNDMYEQAKKYGINLNKARWVAGLLIEAGLLEETQYLHVKATPLGLKLVAELPLMEEIQITYDTEDSADINVKTTLQTSAFVGDTLFDNLRTAARDPMAAGKASGVAFEETIADMFNYMGFEAKRIGGAGNTDVVVRWKDSNGEMITAVVDGKSKSSGTVTHSDVSDVAIETHKEKNNAKYVAIIGPGFGGDTIVNHAKKKGFALITDSELIDIAESTHLLGLSLNEIALLFIVPNGLTQLSELIDAKKREQEILTLVISTFKQEQDAMESLSARDLYFLLRRTELSPSLEELISAFEMLSKEEVGVLSQVKKASAIENNTYELQGGKYCVNRLRALASAIEKGLC